MKPPSILSGIAAALYATTAVAQNTATSTASALSNLPSEKPVNGQLTNQGCYNSSKGLTQIDAKVEFNTEGACRDICNEEDNEYTVGATTGGEECWCGNLYPPEENVVDDSECNIGCTGFDQTACGGLDTWSVYNLGNKLAVHHSDPDDDSTSTSSGVSTQTSTASSSESSQPAESDDESDEGGSSSKTIGIAIGVVAGVLVLGGGGGALLWFLRKKRNQEIEEEHRRNAAVNAFINGSGPPGSSHGSISMTDSRLDPVMATRRMSDGSIADNQDYSRKILRVTNA